MLYLPLKKINHRKKKITLKKKLHIKRKKNKLTVAVLAIVPSRFKAGLRAAFGLFTFSSVFLALTVA
jgi:hypothetical protein